MNQMSDKQFHEIKVLIAQAVDDAVLKAEEKTRTSIFEHVALFTGIEVKDPRELREIYETFVFSQNLKKNTQKAKEISFKIGITALCGGFIALLSNGIKNLITKG